MSSAALAEPRPSEQASRSARPWLSSSVALEIAEACPATGSGPAFDLRLLRVLLERRPGRVCCRCPRSCHQATAAAPGVDLCACAHAGNCARPVGDTGSKPQQCHCDIGPSGLGAVSGRKAGRENGRDTMGRQVGLLVQGGAGDPCGRWDRLRSLALGQSGVPKCPAMSGLGNSRASGQP